MENAREATIKIIGILLDVDDKLLCYHQFKTSSGGQFERWKRHFLVSTVLLNSGFCKIWSPDFNALEVCKSFSAVSICHK